jgi:hypothetical protein
MSNNIFKMTNLKNHRTVNFIVNDADFPDLVTENHAQNHKQTSVLTYASASAAQKEEHKKKNTANDLTPGWAYLSYDKNNRITITKSESIEELEAKQKEEFELEKERIDHIFNKMADNWEWQKDYFFEMYGIDEYNKIFSNNNTIEQLDQDAVDDFDY